MTRWIRHRWAVEGSCEEEVAEAFVACCSPADVYLRRHLSTDAEREESCLADARLMNGWIRFG